MEYKRIEIYVGWTCNQKCTYCMEFHNMERQWTKKITKYEILKFLLKYKKQGYNHVTLLGGEPFIQEVFLNALILGKKIGFVILVTTNATTLHIENMAKKYLPYIDELILSVEAIDKELQQKISRTKVFVKWEEVFKNINKYWKGSYLKANIVITKDNLDELYNIVKYVDGKGIKNIAITYPDLNIDYYGSEHLKTRVAPTYEESIIEVVKIEEYCRNNNILLKIVDFPFCIFPKEQISSFINKTDEIDYGNRLKVGTNLFHSEKLKDYGYSEKDALEIDRKKFSPRERALIDKCENCKYNNLCWGPSINYEILYGYSCINPILDIK